MTTPTDPIPEFKLGADRYARREPVAARQPKTGGLDPETLEVVETFEALYAELSSSAPAPAPPATARFAPDDDLLIELPAEFEPAAPAAPRAAESPTPESRRQLVPDRPPPARAQRAATEADPALDIDDAFAMLRAAETKGRESAERDAVDREEAEDTVAALAPADAGHRGRRTPRAYDVSAAAPDWAGKARAMWPKVAGAAVVALIVGTGVGYMAARAPEPVASQVKIPVTPEGGARLQFDYELTKK